MHDHGPTLKHQIRVKVTYDILTATLFPIHHASLTSWKRFEAGIIGLRRKVGYK